MNLNLLLRLFTWLVRTETPEGNDFEVELADGWRIGPSAKLGSIVTAEVTPP